MFLLDCSQLFQLKTVYLFAPRLFHSSHTLIPIFHFIAVKKSLTNSHGIVIKRGGSEGSTNFGAKVFRHKIRQVWVHFFTRVEILVQERTAAAWVLQIISWRFAKSRCLKEKPKLKRLFKRKEGENNRRQNRKWLFRCQASFMHIRWQNTQP